MRSRLSALQSRSSISYAPPRVLTYNSFAAGPPPGQESYFNYKGPKSGPVRSHQTTAMFYPSTPDFLNPDGSGPSSYGASHSAMQPYSSASNLTETFMTGTNAHGGNSSNPARGSYAANHSAWVSPASSSGAPSPLSVSSMQSWPPPGGNSWGRRPSYEGSGYGQNPYSEPSSEWFPPPESPHSTNSSFSYGGISVNMDSDEVRERYMKKITNSRIGRSCLSVVHSFGRLSQATRSWWEKR